jgi:hypothetical protein
MPTLATLNKVEGVGRKYLTRGGIRPAGAEGIKVLKKYRLAAMARSPPRYIEDVSTDLSKQCAGMAFRNWPMVNGGLAVGTRLYTGTAMALANESKSIRQGSVEFEATQSGLQSDDVRLLPSRNGLPMSRATCAVARWQGSRMERHEARMN